jgi:hypothetical protein
MKSCKEMSLEASPRPSLFPLTATPELLNGFSLNAILTSVQAFRLWLKQRRTFSMKIYTQHLSEACFEQKL